MSLKFLVLDTYYPNFIKKVRNNNKTLCNESYRYQLKYMLSKCFGTSDFYSFNLRKLGYEAIDIIANDEILQRTWANENKLEVEKSDLISKLQTFPLIHKFIGRPDWIQTITLEQIRKEKPDIVYMQDLSVLNISTLKKVKKYCRLLVGQIACPLPNKQNLKQFDLILTSFPHFVERFSKMGIKSEYFKIGFEKRILNKFKKFKRKYNLTFVGGISPSHRKGLKLLNYIAKHIKIDVWGYGKELLLPTSNLYKYHHGEAWALDMYKVLAESKITINRHIDVAENYANNMRLYEATGMGTMLLTDKKDNLGDLFKTGIEVVEYSSPKDLVKKVKYYLKNEKERTRIARKGQLRTLRDHTYNVRMKELIKIIEKYVK